MHLEKHLIGKINSQILEISLNHAISLYRWDGVMETVYARSHWSMLNEIQIDLICFKSSNINQNSHSHSFISLWFLSATWEWVTGLGVGGQVLRAIIE